MLQQTGNMRTRYSHTQMLAVSIKKRQNTINKLNFMKRIIFLCFFFQPLLAFGQTNIVIPATIQQWINGEITKTNKPTGYKALINEDSNGMQLLQLQSNIYVDDFFNEKPAYLIGYIKNYKEVSKSFFLRVLTDDVLSGQVILPLSINIQPDGRFTVKIPNPHPQYSYLWLGNDEGFPFYIEPGRTLGVVIDLKSNGNKVEFQGDLAQKNKDLISIQSNTPELNPYFVYGKGGELSPQEFTEEYTRQYKNTQNKINEYLTKNPTASKAAEIAKFNNMILYASKMLEYAIKKSDSVRIPINFYSFLNELPLDNPQLLAGGQSSSMINRLLHIVQSKLSQQNGLPPGVTRIIVTDQADSTSSASKQIFKELAQEERLLKDSFQLNNSLLVDILKLHSFSSNLSNLPTEEKELFFSTFKAQIKHPFLKRQIDKLRVLDAGIATSKIFEMPKGKTRDFFDGIIAKHKGKYVLVDFWATTCGYCIKDIQNTFSVREKYKNSPDIDFIFITDDSRSPSDESYDKFVCDQRLQYTYRLHNQMYDALCNAFMFNGIPHYALVDKSGKIISGDFSIYRINPESTIENLLRNN